MRQKGVVINKKSNMTVFEQNYTYTEKMGTAVNILFALVGGDPSAVYNPVISVKEVITKSSIAFEENNVTISQTTTTTNVDLTDRTVSKTISNTSYTYSSTDNRLNFDPIAKSENSSTKKSSLSNAKISSKLANQIEKARALSKASSDNSVESFKQSEKSDIIQNLNDMNNYNKGADERQNKNN